MISWTKLWSAFVKGIKTYKRKKSSIQTIHYRWYAYGFRQQNAHGVLKFNIRNRSQQSQLENHLFQLDFFHIPMSCDYGRENSNWSLSILLTLTIEQHRLLRGIHSTTAWRRKKTYGTGGFSFTSGLWSAQDEQKRRRRQHKGIHIRKNSIDLYGTFYDTNQKRKTL